jgi:hypothetical protein
MLGGPWVALFHGGPRTGPRRGTHRSTRSWRIQATGAHRQLRGKEEGGAPILTMGYLGRRGGWYKLAKRVRAWRWGCSDDAMAGVGRTTKCGRKSCSGGCTMSRAPPFQGIGGGGVFNGRRLVLHKSLRFLLEEEWMGRPCRLLERRR